MTDPNPWLRRRPLNIAHQGGSLVAPANTMYAFATASEHGADSLELDVHATADGHLVVLHDATVDHTTDGAGAVDHYTLEQVQRLDAAYWFVAGQGVVHGLDDGDYPLRGIATRTRPAPPGFTPADFTVPTLADVFAAFPGVHVNVDIKNTAPHTAPYEATLARLIDRYERHADVIVASFHDSALSAFKQHTADVSTAVGPAEVARFWSAAQDGGPGIALPHHRALQVPVTFEGLAVVDEHFVTVAHDQGLAVHVWTVNDEPTMSWLLDIGADGVVTDVPHTLSEVLGRRPRPKG